MFDGKRIEDDSYKSNNNNYINIENNDDKDVKEEKQMDNNNNQEQNKNEMKNQRDNLQNIVTTDNKINKITESSKYTENEEDRISDAMIISTNIDDIKHNAINQLVLKENDLQLLMDEEMENIDSCSSGTTATTVISTYFLSPNSSLRSTTLLPSSLLTCTSSTSLKSTTSLILASTIEYNTNENFEFNEELLDNL